MGTILHYYCTNCDKIDGEVFYGVGFRYPETFEDTRLFACDECGEVFARNVNKLFNRCPKCRKKAYELKFYEEDEFDEGEEEGAEIPVKCPNCRSGNI